MALKVGEKLQVVKSSCYNTWINFVLETDRKICDEELREIQQTAGFHPEGYGLSLEAASIRKDQGHYARKALENLAKYAEEALKKD